MRYYIPLSIGCLYATSGDRIPEYFHVIRVTIPEHYAVRLPKRRVATVGAMVTTRRSIVHITFGSHDLEHSLDIISIKGPTGECPRH